MIVNIEPQERIDFVELRFLRQQEYGVYDTVIRQNMKTILLSFLGILFLVSCQDSITGKEKMNAFIENYRSSFLESDLTHYDYNPRVKFEYHSDSVNIGYFIRSDRKMLISFNGVEYLDSNKKSHRFAFDFHTFIVENSESIKRTGIKINWIAEDSIQNLLLIGEDNKSFAISKSSFKIQPIEYFHNLDSLIELYGILEIKKYDDYIQLVFDSENSLIYFIDLDIIDNIDLSLKHINGMWYETNNKMHVDYY